MHVSDRVNSPLPSRSRTARRGELAWRVPVALLGSLLGSQLCASVANAAPELHVSSSYNQTLGVVLWEVTIVQETAGSLAVELPFTLEASQAGNGFVATLQDSGGDSANGATNHTWYYNETAAGSGVLIWNTQHDASDEEQNLGNNPFTGTATEGLWLDAQNRQIFAALGSEINLPTPVPTLHIASSDGRLQWADAMIAEGLNVASLTGSLSSVLLGDANGDGAYNQTDIGILRAATTDFANYESSFPGLDGVSRGDANHDAVLNNLDLALLEVDFNFDYFINGTDLTVWQGAYGANADGDANGNGATDGADFLQWQQQAGRNFPPNPVASATLNVPEPAAVLLLLTASLAFACRGRLLRRPI